MKTIKLIDTGSYKTGMNEVVGLEAAIAEVLAPVLAAIKDNAYWNDSKLEQVEYLSRDGFIPHSHNCGGLELSLHVPKGESYDFGFLKFGECDECGNAEEYPEGDHQCGYKGNECGYESEGYLDAFMRIRLKFEGLRSDGYLGFYLFLEGGNNDAPYFRDVPTLFEASFQCKSVSGLKRASSSAIKQLLKVIGA